jgi:hypothetical protein
VQAGLAGAAILTVAAAALGAADILSSLLVVLLVGLGAHALFAAAELVTPHASNDVHLAAHAMTHGPIGRVFWVGAILAGVVLPLALAIGGVTAAAGTGASVISVVAALAALAGLLAYEDSWIRAGQAVPLS